MNCADTRVLMHGHLDSELDLAGDLEVQRHIKECPRSAREYAAMRAMCTRLKGEAFRFVAPAALKEKIRRAIAVAPPSAVGTVAHRVSTDLDRDVRLETAGENPPCRVMDIQQDGLRKALKTDWSAGVSCRVLTGGKIKVGDAIRLRRS